MMYLMPDGRMMPAHGMPPAMMMGSPHGAPPRPPMQAPGWGAPPPTWGAAPGQPWGTQHPPHQQHFQPYPGVPPPRPPPSGAHQPPPPQWAAPPPPPPGSQARVPPTPNSPAVGGGVALAPGARAGSNDVPRPPASSFSAPTSTPVSSAPAPGAAPASAAGSAAGAPTPKSKKGKKGSNRSKRADDVVTFPTVDEIPAVAPVDVESLPEDVRLYRQERAKNWPGRAREEARNEKAREGSATDAAAAEAEEAERRAARRARLAEVLAEQRRLGHFEASEEMRDLIGDGVDGNGDPSRDERKQRPGGDGRKGRGGRGGGRGASGTREPRRALPTGERDWTGGAKRPSPFESGSVPDSKRGRVDGDGDGEGDGDGDVPRRPREKTRACRFWNAGACRKGDACGFRHDGEPGLSGAPGPYATAVSTEGTSPGDGTEGDASVAPPGDVPPVPVPGDVIPGDAKRAPPPCRHHARGRCSAGASCAFSHGGAAASRGRNNWETDRNDPFRRNAPSRHGQSNKTSNSDKSTLLKKLFAKEVRVDRARLLQVFRFLAANDFLRTETRLDALWVFPWADDPEKDPERDKDRLRKLASEAREEQDAEEEERQ